MQGTETTLPIHSSGSNVDRQGSPCVFEFVWVSNLGTTSPKRKGELINDNG